MDFARSGWDGSRRRPSRTVARSASAVRAWKSVSARYLSTIVWTAGAIAALKDGDPYTFSGKVYVVRVLGGFFFGPRKYLVAK